MEPGEDRQDELGAVRGRLRLIWPQWSLAKIARTSADAMGSGLMANAPQWSLAKIARTSGRDDPQRRPPRPAAMEPGEDRQDERIL